MKIGLILGLLAAFALGFLCRELCDRIAAKRKADAEEELLPAEWMRPECDGEEAGRTFDPAAFAAQRGKDPAKDALLYEAVEHSLDRGCASVSLLQRCMQLRYSAAARLVDEMEEAGIVSRFDGSRPRRLLITREEWDAFREENGIKTESTPN